MKEILTLFSLVFITSLMAQSGNVTVTKDRRIDQLIKKEGAIVPPATAPQLVGYRIQLFFDDNKTSVDEARNKFMNEFPKIDTYVNFTSPNYFLKVGDFRTQMEAEKVKAKIDQLFPTAFIVKEKINLPRIDQ